MKTTSLDILEKALLQPAQAKAILQVMEIEFKEREETLATRADLDVLRQSIRADFAELRVEFSKMKESVENRITRVFVGQTAVFVALLYFAINHGTSR